MGITRHQITRGSMENSKTKTGRPLVQASPQKVGTQDNAIHTIMNFDAPTNFIS